MVCGLPFPRWLQVRDDTSLSCAQRKLYSGCYRCSSPLPHKLSPPSFEPAKRPASGRFCASGLGFAIRNDMRNLSPNGRLSPKLGGWPIYSTSFFISLLNILVSFRNRKIGIPFACLWLVELANRLTRPQPVSPLGLSKCGNRFELPNWKSSGCHLPRCLRRCLRRMRRGIN